MDPEQITPSSEEERDSPSEESAVPTRVIPAEDLFGESREVWIDFHGERYRLRITRRNKLILQK